jgi:hypothetical protein
VIVQHFWFWQQNVEEESSPDTWSNVSLNKRFSLHLVVKQYGECQTTFFQIRLLLPTGNDLVVDGCCLI